MPSMTPYFQQSPPFDIDGNTRIKQNNITNDQAKISVLLLVSNASPFVFLMVLLPLYMRLFSIFFLINNFSPFEINKNNTNMPPL